MQVTGLREALQQKAAGEKPVSEPLPNAEREVLQRQIAQLSDVIMQQKKQLAARSSKVQTFERSRS